MSVRFDDNLEALERTSDLPGSVYTIAFWVSFAAMRDGYLIARVRGTHYDGLFMTTAGHLHIEVDSEYGYLDADAASGYTSDTWYHAALVRASATSLQAFIDGQPVGSNTTQQGASSATLLDLSATLSGYWIDARMAGIKIWNAALTAAELQAEMRCLRPLRALDLYGWYPCFPGADERLRDYSGSGRHWTASGALSDDDPPPVSWGAPVSLMQFVSTASIVSAEAALAGGGALASIGLRVGVGLSALSGGGQLSGASLRIVPGTAQINGNGALAGTAGAVFAACALAGTGELLAAVLCLVSAGAALVGSGLLAGTSRRIVPGAAALDGGGVIAAAGEPIHYAHTSLTGAGALTAEGVLIAAALASLSGYGSLWAFPGGAALQRLRLWAVPLEGRLYAVLPEERTISAPAEARLIHA